MGAGMLGSIGAALGNIGGMMYQGAQREEAEQRADARAIASEERAWTRDLAKIKMATDRALEEKKRQGAAYSSAQASAGKSIDTDREAYVRQALGLPEGAPVSPELMDEYSPKSQRGVMNRTQDELMKLGETDLAKIAAERADKMGTEEREAKRDERQASRDAVSDSHWQMSHKLQREQLQASLRASRDAAADRQEKREDKKAVRDLYDQLGHYVESAKDDPAKYDAQIKRTLVELKKYGEDATKFVYGELKDTGNKVETKSMDAEGNEIKNVQAVKQNVGGLINTKPSGGKPFNIQPGVNGEYVMKDGKRFFVPYK
jgi:hypothetical protein